MNIIQMKTMTFVFKYRVTEDDIFTIHLILSVAIASLCICILLYMRIVFIHMYKTRATHITHVSEINDRISLIIGDDVEQRNISSREFLFVE